MKDWDEFRKARIKELSEKIDALVALRDSYVMASDPSGLRKRTVDELPVREWDDKAGY